MTKHALLTEKMYSLKLIESTFRDPKGRRAGDGQQWVKNRCSFRVGVARGVHLGCIVVPE